MEAIHNPFEQISARLSVIEQLLIDIKHCPPEKNTQPVRRSMSLEELCKEYGFAKQTVYRLTSRNEIPYCKQRKRLFFDRAEIENWILSNRRATTGEAAQQANDFIQSAARRTRSR